MRAAILGLIFMLFVGGCTNVSQRGGRSSTGDPSVFSAGSFAPVNYTHMISNISAQSESSGTGGNATPQIRISLAFNTGAAGYQPISNFCSLGANACACELKWKQTNSNGEYLYDRSRRIAVTQVQSGSVSCVMRESEWGELTPGTIISMRVVPASGNVSGLNCKPLGYRVGQLTNPNGDFLDDSLNAFRNVHRYSCFSKRTAPHEILNRFANSTVVTMASSNPRNGLTIRTSVGSCFCTAGGQTAGGSGGACSSLQCPENARSGYSAQNYYRNLYVPSNVIGSINASNGTFDCPKVLESVKVSASSDSSTGYTTIPQAEQGRLWPLDSSFALASSWSSEWSVGVRAASVLSKVNPAGQENTPTNCVNGNQGFIENGIVPKCLGYAKTPNPDGTCGVMTDSKGNIRPLVRLRRYRALLPPRFAANGDLDGAGAQGGTQIYPPVDEVYVADRLVLNSQTSLPTGEMIYGPKPCNYAWFDHEGVVNRGLTSNDFNTNVYTTPSSGIGLPSYVATNQFYRGQPNGTSWSASQAVNPDGLIFPNHDKFGAGIGNRNQASCSASIPTVNYASGQPNSLTLFTSNSTRTSSLTLGGYSIGSKSIKRDEIHLRPIDPWVPNYLEDTSFKACVPISSEYTEPPLHIYKDSGGRYAWCAEAYPSQNPYWMEINKKRRVFSPTNSTNPDTIYQNNLVNYPSGTAKVRGYTSHTSSVNACSGTLEQQICTMTVGGSGATYNNCVAYLTGHSTTACDRTVVYDQYQDYRDFPLLADSGAVEQMLADDLSHDASFSCSYSVSSDPAKVNQQFPSSACCGIKSGLPVLQGLISAGAAGGAHVEPYLDSSAPNFRYCGSPVQ